MAKSVPEYTTAPIMYIREKDDFQDVDFATPLNGPFDVANPIQALQMEATAKGMGVCIRAALVPLERFFGVPEEEESDDGSGTETSQ